MSRRHWRPVLYAVCLAGMAFAANGCSDDDIPRQPVSGYVTLDGQPLANGVIVFYPGIENRANNVVGGTIVKNGYFSLPRSEGLPPGRYEVAINSANAYKRSRREERKPGNEGAAEKEPIPAKYNDHTTLAIHIKDTAIKEMTFQLDSK
jgi:hypothetical protein